ncbi:MAG: RNA-binding protein [Gallionellales bacterium 35-53-114]|jgi:23S rRNA pseudouridine2604 synthase|nr:MAG: RNA-binding protein [Gallionellales bacterium 35-53-114]OYZ63017.1 MAG: RNA-binding protein [Gallionellales bacterium 24-53-125]OZB09001.1 MAG: RNA-binding protein [Gallionellales bacterium 39-52-133]HQS59319.1 RNA pseudouridine synthase [Gallionellaceae bacterium]HQS76232.1 RNA pseudouridine synthase [Gallionellaceae bacterium]
MTDSIRLAKHVAMMVPCSRSEAEKYIEAGFVTVDGQIIEEPGFRVQAAQRVELMPDATLAEAEAVTILLHKPAGFDIETDAEAVYKLITPENQAADDRSGIHFIKRHLKGLLLADTLGIQSSGLMVLTQDWRIARKLITDAEKVEQEFVVEIAGEILPEAIEQLNQGIQTGGKLLPVKVSKQSESRLRFAVKGNQRIQIAGMCEKAGLKVVAMKRIRIGRVPMASLQAGQWRYMLGYEKF